MGHSNLAAPEEPGPVRLRAGPTAHVAGRRGADAVHGASLAHSVPSAGGGSSPKGHSTPIPPIFARFPPQRPPIIIIGRRLHAEESAPFPRRSPT